MANTITNTRLVCGHRRVVQYITIASDGSEETGLVIYDSSAVATANGKTDPLNSRIRGVQYMTSSLNGVVQMLWDATTDVVALSMPKNNGYCEFDFMSYGGLKNTAGSGITGDILLTTTGLDAGDTMVIILDIDPEYPS